MHQKTGKEGLREGMSNQKLLCIMPTLIILKDALCDSLKKYIELCPHTPDEANAFYLQPAVKPTENCWYNLKPLGHNTLTKTMSRLCIAAGIEGF